MLQISKDIFEFFSVTLLWNSKILFIHIEMIILNFALSLTKVTLYI